MSLPALEYTSRPMCGLERNVYHRKNFLQVSFHVFKCVLASSNLLSARIRTLAMRSRVRVPAIQILNVGYVWKGLHQPHEDNWVTTSLRSSGSD